MSPAPVLSLNPKPKPFALPATSGLMRPTGSTPAPCSTHLARRESPFRAIVDSKDPQMIEHTGPSLRVHSQLKLEMLVKLISCSVFCDVIFNHPCTRILARPHIECTGKSLRLQPMACLLCPKATAPRPKPQEYARQPSCQPLAANGFSSRRKS